MWMDEWMEDGGGTGDGGGGWSLEGDTMSDFYFFANHCSSFFPRFGPL
jgi:hypothetical protein